jgi:hypothetical protein
MLRWAPETVASPTAVQAVVDAHETLRRREMVAPTGLGVVWIVHAPALRLSASDSLVPELLVYMPTAVHSADDDGHETPSNWEEVVPAGLGVALAFSDVNPVVLVDEYASVGPPTELYLPTFMHEEAGQEFDAMIAVVIGGVGTVVHDSADAPTGLAPTDATAAITDTNSRALLRDMSLLQNS